MLVAFNEELSDSCLLSLLAWAMNTIIKVSVMAMVPGETRESFMSKGLLEK